MILDGIELYEAEIKVNINHQIESIDLFDKDHEILRTYFNLPQYKKMVIEVWLWITSTVRNDPSAYRIMYHTTGYTIHSNQDTMTSSEFEYIAPYI